MQQKDISDLVLQNKVVVSEPKAGKSLGRRVSEYALYGTFIGTALFGSGCVQTSGIQDGHKYDGSITIQQFYYDSLDYEGSDKDKMPDNMRYIPFNYYGKRLSVETISGKEDDAYRWLQKHNFYGDIIGDKRSIKLIRVLEESGVNIEKLEYLLNKIGKANLSCYMYNSGQMYIADHNKQINYLINTKEGIATKSEEAFK